MSGPGGDVLTELRRNLENLRRRIDGARRRSPRAAEAVRLVVVTKAQPRAVFPLLAAAGVTDVAENRVQAAETRRPGAPPALTWHGIGHLQRNKAAAATRLFDVFHALDSLRLAARLESVLASEDRRWPVYIQVNAAHDPAKGGVEVEETLAFMRAITEHPHLVPQGFMTMARLDADHTETRRAFATLRELRDDVIRAGIGDQPPQGLSMGMTGDFELAVEEGATVVRIGTAVFEGVSLAQPARESKEDRP